MNLILNQQWQNKPESMPSVLSKKQQYAIDLQKQIDENRRQYKQRDLLIKPYQNLAVDPSNQRLQSTSRPSTRQSHKSYIQKKQLASNRSEKHQPQQQQQQDFARNVSFTGPKVDEFSLLQKKIRSLELQKDLDYQIEERKRIKEEQKQKIKDEYEKEEARLEKERLELKFKMLEEINQNKQSARNLQESNYEIQQAKMKMQQQPIELKKSIRVRTPVEEVEQNLYRDQDNLLRKQIEQRIIRELPVEVEKTVKERLNIELNRLRDEISVKNNSVSDELVSLKQQLLRANENKLYKQQQFKRLKTDEHLNYLRDQLKQTQMVDEIRTRELYEAFVGSGSKQNQIIYDTTNRFDTPEDIKVDFPKRTRPYYNLSDPYLNSAIRNKDVHKMLGSDKIQMMPVRHDSEGIFDFYKNYLDKNEVIQQSKGYNFSLTDLPEQKQNNTGIIKPLLSREKSSLTKKGNSINYQYFQHEEQRFRTQMDLFTDQQDNQQDYLQKIQTERDDRNEIFEFEEDNLRKSLLGYQGY